MFHALSLETCALAPEGSHTAFAVSASKASIPSRAYFLPTPFIALIFKPHFCRGFLFLKTVLHIFICARPFQVYSVYFYVFTYLTTIFIIFPGTTISLIIVLPSTRGLIFSSASAILIASSFVASFGTATVDLTLPFI